jgi:uncharacterized protein (DUF1501 family)
MNDPIDFDDDGAGFGKATRRTALKALSLGAAASSPLFASLLASGNAAAQTAGDYKSLVVVFQNGGNDHANSIVPRGSAYGAYQSARPAIAVAENSLLAINPTGFSGPSLGFAPQLTGFRTLFEGSKLALVSNVGTLVEPVTKAQYAAGSKKLPFQLFSHSDQQRAWETGYADKDSRTGWLGRMGDAVAGAFNPNSQVSICMSISGNNVIQQGESTPQFQLNSNGPVRIDELGGLYGSAAGGAALRKLITEGRWHMLEGTYNGITARAITSGEIVSNTLSAAGPELTTKFPENDMGRQAKMVAHMIRIRQQLGQRRQIFFIATGGWDVHDDLPDTHSKLLGDMDSGLSALYAATVEMGLADTVTTFTASDFGRALQTNGRGSDHGWGGHHFVLGGAVQGKRIYGAWPQTAIGGAEDAGQGRLIPTTSTDEYAATLCRWFGADSTQMAGIMPNLGKFATPNLGFLG